MTGASTAGRDAPIAALNQTAAKRPNATAVSPVNPATEAGPPVVVATTSILGDIAANVAGDDAQVEVLMPPGADPHTFEASAADAARVREADLVLTIGLGIEAPLASLLDSARADGVDIVALAPQLDPIPFTMADLHDDEDHADEQDHADEDEHDGEEPHGAEDPHVWFDPVRMAEGVGLLGDEFERRLGPGAWQERADAYRSELLDVHDEVEGLVAAVPPERRVLVTNHEAVGYFAHRYDFESRRHHHPRRHDRCEPVVRGLRGPGPTRRGPRAARHLRREHRQRHPGAVPGSRGRTRCRGGHAVLRRARSAGLGCGDLPRLVADQRSSHR